MNETKLIERILKIINSNYHEMYVIDIVLDKVYKFAFNESNNLIIQKKMTYTDFINYATEVVHKDEVSGYFNALSLNKLVSSSIKGNNETKYTYRKLCVTGEYRWYVNIINYLPFEGHKLIFMMSEDINERKIESEEHNLKLESEVVKYKKRIENESNSISDAIVKINDLLDNTNTSNLKTANTKEYINSIFTNVSLNHPELKEAITSKVITNSNYVKPSILIVDDSEVIRKNLKRIFESEYNIIMAKDGKEAIDIINLNILSKDNLNKHNIVAILLDLIMPNVDGFEVLSYLKKNNIISRIPIAIISGDETIETRKRAYQYDIDDLLEKPFNPDNIRTRISKLISLYISSNNMQALLNNKNKKEIQMPAQKSEIDIIFKKFISNIITNDYSNRLKNMTKAISTHLKEAYPDYKLDKKYIEAITSGVPLYNIGAIIIDENEPVTKKSMKESIEYGKKIALFMISDKYTLDITNNIIMYSCEMYNGTGFPNGLVGNDIPIEAQIANIAIRLCSKKTILSLIKKITEEEHNKYNPDLIEVINANKKELKKI